MDIRTQQFRIGRYLAGGGKLTPIEALDRFGCFRLGARIYDLKRAGWKIHRELIKVGSKRVAQYSLRVGG